IALLEDCVREAEQGGDSESYTRQQLEKMLEFTRTVSSWYAQIDRLSASSLRRLFLGGAKLARLFGSEDAGRDEKSSGPPSRSEEGDSRR
ncbi:MAG TPA: hypothetical protein VFT74_14560, partial [Isosphaeraceae bacterium]|nr:hypothetical protein [Isosphaeraceae bacterium]